MFDFTDLENFAEDVPHDALRQLRRFTPVCWNPAPTPAMPEDGFWLITKHQDIRRIEKNPALFSSHFGLTLADAPSATVGPPWSMVRDGLTHLDPPEHYAHKQIVAPSFTPRAVTRMEARIQAIAIEVIERACELREFDFAHEVALRFPVAVVLGEALGLPAEHFARAVRWSDVIAAPNDPEFSRSEGATVIHEIYDYALATLEARRREPKHDILSVLAHTKINNGNYMSDEMFVRYFWSLLTGAFDTTASAISGGMLAFIAFPEQYERLLLNPSLLSTAVEEILRWETPTIYFRRTAMADTEIRGQRIQRGQRVVMCYASANRDEEEFVNPDTFDVSRKPNNHLSFGYGQHFCLGANLARAEIRILFELIIQRNLHLGLRGEIRRARSNFQNRIKQMPVSIKAI
ncbi:MAG: cytochrome P450 [Acidobacteria bacterium]|nr:cytochrome P450 [Acidobacteriota bacterium]